MNSAAEPGTSPVRAGLAWSVHAFTASGAVVGVLALLSAAAGDFRGSALWMLVAMAIDAVDGALARAARVREVLPFFDGRRLDDLVDYLNFVIVPAVFVVSSGAVEHWIFAAVPVLASAYGFAQVDAKTDDHFFLGFPSYWNVVAIYLWTLGVPAPVGAAILVVLAGLVFVPLKYVYPSRTRPWRVATNVGATVWTLLLAAAVAFPERLAGIPLLEISLLYGIYYVVASFVLGDWPGTLAELWRRGRRRHAGGGR